MDCSVKSYEQWKPRPTNGVSSTMEFKSYLLSEKMLESVARKWDIEYLSCMIYRLFVKRRSTSVLLRSKLQTEEPKPQKEEIDWKIQDNYSKFSWEPSPCLAQVSHVMLHYVIWKLWTTSQRLQLYTLWWPGELYQRQGGGYTHSLDGRHHQHDRSVSENNISACHSLE